MRKYALLFTILVMLFAFFGPQPQAEAIDPVTIAILAPIAIQVVRTMMPYVLKALVNMSREGLKAGKEAINMLRLPLGVVQTFLLFPFGHNFSGGIRNIGYGCVAPFKLGFHVFMMPFAAFGVGL